MSSLSLFKLYQHADRLSAEWGVAECPGVIIRKQCQDVCASEMLEPLRDAMPGSLQETEILEKLFAPFQHDGMGWKIETKNHLALTQWIGDHASHSAFIAAKQQVKLFAQWLQPIKTQVFETRDDALKAVEQVLPVSQYLP